MQIEISNMKIDLTLVLRISIVHTTLGTYILLRYSTFSVDLHIFKTRVELLIIIHQTVLNM